MTISRSGRSEGGGARGWQSGAELRKSVWRELRIYQELYRQVATAFKAPKPLLLYKCAGIHLQVRPSEHILGLSRPNSCTRWVAVGLNVLHTALPLTCQLGACSRALDWVCLPARRSGSPLACTSCCTTVVRVVYVVRWLYSMLTQCSPNSPNAHSLFGRFRHGWMDGWNSLLQKLSRLRHLSERGGLSS
jgi:hypothetical protein